MSLNNKINQKDNTNIINNKNLLPTPTQITSYLDKFVKGQDEAKKAIALSVYTHFLQALSGKFYEHLDDDDEYLDNFIPQHLLLIGPTGCGKSYLVKKAIAFLDICCSFFSASSLVQTGYAGLKIDDMIELHYENCDKNIYKTQLSVIFLDEIDKIRLHKNSDGGPDVSGEGVQNALLTLFDGNPINIFPSQHKVKVTINTKHILFVCTGSFAMDLANIIRDRTQENEINNEEILSLVDSEDLVKFGLIPEFVGRFSRIVSLKSLKARDLMEILLESKESPLKKHQHLFKLHGIKLDFTPSALNIIAKQAIQLKTGARALNRIFQKSLLNLEFQLPELAQKGVNQITIDEYSLLEGKPKFQYSFCLEEKDNRQFNQLREDFGKIKNRRQKPKQETENLLIFKPSHNEYESGNFNVLLEDFGENKIKILKTIRSINGWGLKQTKEFIDSLPGIVKTNLSKKSAQDISNQLENSGGKVSITYSS